MEEAEIRNTIQLFGEASKLFSKAKDFATRQKASLLSRANENYCLAMALGLKFRESLMLEDYRRAKSHLVEASNCYTSAGVLETSDWLTAMERMLDAYTYVARAPAEIDPKDKARNYSLAEEILKQSAEIFERSGYAGRKNEVLVALGKVKREKDFALSLVAMLSTPNAASVIPTFPPPNLSNELASGLEELKRPNLQISLALGDDRGTGKDPAIYAKLKVRVHIINTGKEPARIHKIEGAAGVQNCFVGFE
ncbi:MAG: hypothetical protein JRN15_21010 [Nitrososphaerota archaeon]|nr:hypothetical protein [Nitrososphaerota archaeon]